MNIANDTYVPTSPALCLGTLMLRQNPKALSTDGMPKVTYNSHTYITGLYDINLNFLMATLTSHAYSHLVSLCTRDGHSHMRHSNS